MPMYDLLKYSSNYSDITGSLWFYYKDEATIFNNDIVNTDAFKSFKYMTKLLGNTEVDGVNRILRNTTITVPLKHLSNLWRPLGKPLINCKVEVKLKWTKYCLLALNGTENDDANSNNIVSLSSTQNYVCL